MSLVTRQAGGGVERIPKNEKGLTWRTLFQSFDVTGHGQDVKLVVEKDGRVVGGQGQDETLVEPVDNVFVRLCSVPAVTFVS